MNTKTKIAPPRPFEGAPKLNLPSILGASHGKPILFRIPVTGERPMEYSATGLPAGLALNDNILSGTVEKDGNYEITLTAKNALGVCSKTVTLEIADGNVLVTPLLGYTTWNAFASTVSQEAVEGIAARLVELGITEYGYSYVNTDSGWQGIYGGEFDAIMPNEKFPDMKKMTDTIHAYGLKCGIYATPMLTAWRCPEGMESIPGCTQGEADPRFGPINGGIGVIHKEKNNALQWNAWGFDYLKYDWAPTDPVNADLMRKELDALPRDFGYCVTVQALKECAYYWSKYCNSYRCNSDTYANRANLEEVYSSYFNFMDFVCKGHYFDLDMLDFGTCKLHTLWHALTDDEKIMEFSMRAFVNSPIQISSTLEEASDLELAIYCNEEILAIHQDCGFHTARPVLRIKDDARRIDVLEKELEDSAFAYAFFNLGDTDESFTPESDTPLRDVWAKETLSSLTIEVPAHTARILKSAKKISFAS